VSPLYYQNNDHGIYVDGAFTSANNLTIKNNVFYRNERGWSIQIYPAAVNNLRILNNTFPVRQPLPGWPHYIIGAAHELRDREQYFLAANDRLPAIHHYLGILKPECGQQSDVPRDGGCGVYAWGIALAGNLDNIDPRLVTTPSCTVDAASAPDAHLQLGSPALDTGLTLLDVPNDYDGTPRPQGGLILVLSRLFPES